MTTALRHPVSSVTTGEPLRPSASAERRRPSGLLVTLAVLTVCGTLLVAAYVQAQLVTGQHRIDTLERQRIEEQSQLQNDRVALAQAQSPERIARRAAELGMRTPDVRIMVGADTAAEAGATTDRAEAAEAPADEVTELAGPAGAAGR